jgi:hypothetical protein
LQERDKLSLDITWLRDESLEDTDNLPDPAILAAEIVEDLRAARISYFRRMARPRLKAMIEMCGVGRALFGTDCGPVPMSPKLHIDAGAKLSTGSRSSMATGFARLPWRWFVAAHQAKPPSLPVR